MGRMKVGVAAAAAAAVAVVFLMVEQVVGYLPYEDAISESLEDLQYGGNVEGGAVSGYGYGGYYGYGYGNRGGGYGYRSGGGGGYGQQAAAPVVGEGQGGSEPSVSEGGDSNAERSSKAVEAETAAKKAEEEEEDVVWNLVVEVNEVNWDAVVGDGSGIVLVTFFEANSTAFEAMVPDFMDAAELLEGEITLATVNSTENGNLTYKYGVEWSPTLKIFIDGKFHVDYRGSRTSEDIVEFISKIREPPITTIRTEEELQFFLDETEGMTRVYSHGFSNRRLKRLGKIALDMRSQFVNICAFAAIETEELVQKAAQLDYIPDIDDTGILFVHKAPLPPEVTSMEDVGESGLIAEAPVVFFDEESAHDMSEFVTLHIVPLIGAVEKTTALMYKDLNIPVVIAFHERESVLFGKMEDLMYRLAQVFREFMLFAYGNPFDNEPALESLFPGVGHDHPRVAVLWLASKNNPQTFTPETTKDDVDGWLRELENWIRGYYGRLDPKNIPESVKPRRSEAASGAKGKGAFSLNKVVAKDWDKVVEDSSRDVLLLIHDGKGGEQTAALGKELKELKSSLGKNSPSLVVAEFNTKKNSLPSRYASPSYPVIRLFPAGPAPKRSLLFSGSIANAQEIFAWLKEGATHAKDLVPESKPAGNKGESNDEL